MTHHGKAKQFSRDYFIRWHVTVYSHKGRVEGWHAATHGLGSNLYELCLPDKTIPMILCYANGSTTMGYYIKSAPVNAVAAMGRQRTLPLVWLLATRKSPVPV